MADRITGLYTLTIGETPENTMTVFNANPQTATHWLEFWHAEARDGRFQTLTIEENGTFDHSDKPTEPSVLTSGLFRVQTWRSGEGFKASIVHTVKHLSTIYSLLLDSLECAGREGGCRLTKAVVSLQPQPVRIPVRQTVLNVTADVRTVSQAILRLADPFGDWTHTQEVVTAEVEAAAERLSNGL